MRPFKHILQDIRKAVFYSHYDHLRDEIIATMDEYAEELRARRTK